MMHHSKFFDSHARIHSSDNVTNTTRPGHTTRPRPGHTTRRFQTRSLQIPQYSRSKPIIQSRGTRRFKRYAVPPTPISWSFYAKIALGVVAILAAASILPSPENSNDRRRLTYDITVQRHFSLIKRIPGIQILQSIRKAFKDAKSLDWGLTTDRMRVNAWSKNAERTKEDDEKILEKNKKILENERKLSELNKILQNYLSKESELKPWILSKIKRIEDDLDIRMDKLDSFKDKMKTGGHNQLQALKSQLAKIKSEIDTKPLYSTHSRVEGVERMRKRWCPDDSRRRLIARIRESERCIRS